MKYKYYLKEGKLKSYNPLHQGHSEMYGKIINEIQQENHYSNLNIILIYLTQKDYTKHIQMVEVSLLMVINYMLLGHLARIILNQILMIF